MQGNTKAAPPKPETTRAILMSAGVKYPTPTIHFYKETRLVSVPKIGIAWEHVFECAKTGATRRWGLERVEGDTSDLELN